MPSVPAISTNENKRSAPAKARAVYWAKARAVYQAQELRKEMEEEVAPLLGAG